MIALVEELTLEEIVARNVSIFKEENPEIELEGESDYYMPLIQAWSESELRLRVETNHGFNQFVWMYASGDGLDMVSEMFGIYRLAGTKPTTRFLFTLLEPKDVDTYVPSLLLGGDGEESVVEEFVVPAGMREVEVVGVLEKYIEETSTKTEALLTTLPYVAEVTQLDSFSGGATEESDEALRERIRLAFAEFSTAGPAKAYIKRATEADSRIQDVVVWEEQYGVVLTIDATTYDSVLEERVLVALNREEVRPLTDKITLQEAVVVPVSLTARLTLRDLSMESEVARAIEARMTLLKRGIGEQLSKAQLTAMLFVDGVVDVLLTTPEEEIEIERNEVVRVVSLEFSYEA